MSALVRFLALAAPLICLPVSGGAEPPPCYDYAESFHYVAGLPVEHVTYDFMGYTCLAVKGRKAYAYQQQRGLRVFDLADERAPVHRGIVSLPSGAWDIACIDHYVLAAGGGLQVVDVDDHDQPFVTAIVTTPDSPYGVAVRQRLAYVACDDAGLLVYDVDNPEAPELLTTVTTSAAARSVIVNGDLLLVGGVGVLDVFDLTVPAAPALVGSLAGLGERVEKLAARAELALLDVQGDAVLVDLSDPAAPAVLASGFDTLTVSAVALTDGVAWVGGDVIGAWGGALDRYDVTDPNEPVFIGRTMMNGWPNALVFSLGYLYSANGGDWLDGAETEGFHVYDPTYPQSPPQLGYVDLQHYWLNYGVSVLRGDFLYVCADHGMATVDLSDPASPFQRAMLSTYTYALHAVILGDWVFTRCLDNSIRTYDVSNPDVITAGGYLTGGGGLNQMGDYVYLARDDGIHVVTMDGHEPVVLQVIRPDDPVSALVQQGSRVVGIDLSYDLRVMELQDPFTLLDLGELPAVPGRTRIPRAMLGDLVFTDFSRPSSDWPWNSTWEIIDISDPANPTVRCEVPLPFEDYLSDLTVAAGRLIVTGSTNSTVYDVSDPDTPILLGEFPNVSTYETWVHANDNILVSHQSSSAQITTWPLPCADVTGLEPAPVAAPRLELVAAPNPFNPRTNLRFTVPVDGPVEVALYDVRGRLVRRLVDAYLRAGEHAAVWDGRDDAGWPAASGVYLARMVTPSGATATRLTLVR